MLYVYIRYKCVKLYNNTFQKDVYIHKLVREYYNVSVPNHMEKSNGGSGENSEVREESDIRDDPVPSS